MIITEVEYLWQKGRALEAGRLLFESLPQAVRPAWARTILEWTTTRLGIHSREIDHLIQIGEAPSTWRSARAIFHKLRTGTLRLEDLANKTDRQHIELDQLYLAENVAKVIYNATEPQDAFDEDAGWWVVSCLWELTKRLNDREFAESAWSVLQFGQTSKPEM